MKNLKIFTENIEQEAIDQINTLLDQPAFANCKVRIMPDVHAGAGCVIGFTANLGEKVIPNIVGVDIGCGMRVVNLGKIEIDYAKLDRTIRTHIPSGMAARTAPYQFWDLRQLRCFDHLKNVNHIANSLGTLGGGNHFIEIDEAADSTKYLVIHTGSRNLGKQVADYYQRLAISTCHNTKAAIPTIIEQLKAEGRQHEIAAAIAELKAKAPEIPDALCYLEGQNREDYLHDMRLCQEYAVLNREIIANILIHKMYWGVWDSFETIHNYIDDHNMVRKGAIAAHYGELVVIPINMRDGCIIGHGKGNLDWNESAPHGAGRLMSRSRAKKEIALDVYAESMSGIYTTSVGVATLDEAPQAYKPMEEILELVGDTIDIVDIVKSVYNFKAGD